MNGYVSGPARSRHSERSSRPCFREEYGALYRQGIVERFLVDPLSEIRTGDDLSRYAAAYGAALKQCPVPDFVP